MPSHGVVLFDEREVGRAFNFGVLSLDHPAQHSAGLSSSPRSLHALSRTQARAGSRQCRPPAGGLPRWLRCTDAALLTGILLVLAGKKEHARLDRGCVHPLAPLPRSAEGFVDLFFSSNLSNVRCTSTLGTILLVGPKWARERAGRGICKGAGVLRPGRRGAPWPAPRSGGMYILRDGKVPKSHRRSPRREETATASGTGSELPGIRTRGAASPLPTLLDWQSKSTPKSKAHSQARAGARWSASGGRRRRGYGDAATETTFGRSGNQEHDSSGDGSGQLISDDLSPSRPDHSYRPTEYVSILSPSSKFNGQTSPRGRTSPPGLGSALSPKVYQDAGRSTMFIGRIPHLGGPGSATKADRASVPAPQRPHSAGNGQSAEHSPGKHPALVPLKSSATLGELHTRTRFMWGNRNSLSTLRSGQSRDGLESIYHDSIHPCYGVFFKSWNNFDLFKEFAGGGEDDPKTGSLLKNLTERKDLLDFIELLDLLRSLQVLCPRGGTLNTDTQVTVTQTHELFLEVNRKRWTAHVSSSGMLGEENMDQCSFDEYQQVMLCIAHSLGIPLDILLPRQEDLTVDRATLIKDVESLTSKAHLRSIENKPGTAQFLARRENKNGVQIAFKNVDAARQACKREEFDRARAHSQYATTVLLQHLRPDLLCEIKLLEQEITREENTVYARKKKAQAKVEEELLRANHMSRDLNIDMARAQIAKAVKMSESARLPMKGQLRCCVKESEKLLEDAERAIQGDKKLAIAWRSLQRDELKDARSAYVDARELYAGLEFREVALHAFEEALEKKAGHDTERKERGRALLERAHTETEAGRFEAAHGLIEEARAVFMEWTIPVGRNQVLTEHVTKMFKQLWTDEQLYTTFCAFDLDNLSGAGARALMMDFNELLQLFRHLGILSERQKGEEDRPKTVESAASKKMPKARLAAIEQRQALIESCTSPEIRKSEKAKIAKADVYTEFRAVNSMSVADLAGGNLEADDDMSSLDWSEYRLLIMRIAKILDVPVTDAGCSPLFAKDVERVDLMQEELDRAKKNYLKGIVSTGEKYLSASRVAVQDKRFDDAIVEVHNAEAEFNRVWEEKIKNAQVNLLWAFMLARACGLSSHRAHVGTTTVRRHKRRADSQLSAGRS